jgi:acetolactate synthase-1/2/3 large subunit
MLMNDRGYGVIRNIQDAQYGGRRYYADLHTPDFERLAQSIALPYQRVTDLVGVDRVLRDAIGRSGPTLVEVDMVAIGPFANAFAGPPVKKEKERAT